MGLYLQTSSALILKKSIVSKHRYLLDFFIENPNVEICSYITKNGFSLFSFRKPFKWLGNVLRFWEHRYVMRKNSISKKNVKVLTKPEMIKDGDIVIMGPGGSIPIELKQKNIFKVITLMHAYGYKEEADAMREKSPHLVYNECNVFKFSPLFKKNYGWYDGDFLLIPFVAQQRFNRNKPFSERDNRCFSVGTITYRDNPEFISLFGDSCVQPIRKMIYDNKQLLEEWIACYNSDYYEKEENVKEYLPSDSKITHFRKVWYNTFHTGQQKKYFSFNMVEKFNDYKMCLIGEEILGLPGIGFVEGMACGCAYIGQNCGYYEDYGMQEGVHYIGYDGTLENLKAKITYYQRPEHQEELERIANAGYEFAQTHFKGEIVAQELLDKLQKAYAEWKVSK